MNSKRHGAGVHAERKTRYPFKKFSGHRKVHLTTKEKHSNNGQTSDLVHPRAFRHDPWELAIRLHQTEDQKQAMLDAVRKRIHDEVCSRCIDHGYDGACYSQDPAGCTLNRMLPEIVEAISSVESPFVKDYADTIRARVCAHCDNQDKKGHCEVRDAANCGLDTYLTLVINAVEALGH